MNVVMNEMAKVILGIALLGAFSMPAVAQDLRVGVVNIQALMEQAPQTKAAMDALQEEFAPRQREFAAKQKEFEDLRVKAEKDFTVMGGTERDNAERELRELQREVTRLQNEFREDLNLRQNEELGKLQRTLLKDIQDYAEAEGYDLIVGDGVLYASSAVNITNNVLQAVEANFQAAGGSR